VAALGKEIEEALANGAASQRRLDRHPTSDNPEMILRLRTAAGEFHTPGCIIRLF